MESATHATFSKENVAVDLLADLSTAVNVEDEQVQRLREERWVKPTTTETEAEIIERKRSKSMPPVPTEDLTKHLFIARPGWEHNARDADSVASRLPWKSFLNVDLYDYDGRKRSFKEMFDAPEWEILPDAKWPLWKQLSVYCMRWGVWVMEIENEERRGELRTRIEGLLRNVWEFAIKHGHCGEPNGHTTCCLGDPITRQYTHEEEKPKRNKDVGRQPAPFSCAGGKHAYSILNRELEQAEITPEEIYERMNHPECLDVGNRLLADMCQALKREHLEIQDWTSVSRYRQFNPLTQGRNLFMYCLWEVQRCRNTIQRLQNQLNKTGAPTRYMKLEKTKSTYEDRANEHLALAVELDSREAGDCCDNNTNDDKEDIAYDESNAEENGGEEESRSCSDVELPEGHHNEGIVNNDSEPSEEFTRQLMMQRRRSDIIKAYEAAGKPRPTSYELDGLIAAEDAALADEEVNFVPQNADDSDGNMRDKSELVGTKRRLSEHDHTSLEKESKRIKLNIGTHGQDNGDTFCRVQHASSDRTYSPVFRQTPILVEDDDSATVLGVRDNATSAASQTGHDFQPGPVSQTVQAPILNSKSAVPNEDTSQTKLWKTKYTLENWQPRINELLAQSNYPALKWELLGWNDIKGVLEHLGTSTENRNNYLREFKAGFAGWVESEKRGATDQIQDFEASIQQPINGQSQLQYQREPGAPQSSPPTSSPSCPSATLQTYRGFSFRYFPTTNSVEQEEADDMAEDYVATVIEEDIQPRQGFYVVFTKDGVIGAKQIAHGFWSMSDDTSTNSRSTPVPAPDAQWFYNDNEPRHVGFRSDVPKMYHEWGHSIALPIRSSSRMRCGTGSPNSVAADYISRSPSSDLANSASGYERNNATPNQRSAQRASSTLNSALRGGSGGTKLKFTNVQSSDTHHNKYHNRVSKPNKQKPDIPRRGRGRPAKSATTSSRAAAAEAASSSTPSKTSRKKGAFKTSDSESEWHP